MSPEAQRIAVAELCGWTDIRINWQQALGGTPPGLGGKGNGIVPDYLNDLNATHEMEATFRRADMWHAYVKAIEKKLDHDREYESPLLHVDAATRVECFLRVHGKWNDAK